MTENPSPPESTTLPDDVAGMPPEAARAEIDRIRADTAHAWHQPGHRQHAEAMTRMEALYKRATPPDPGTTAAEPSAATPPVEAPVPNALSPETAAQLPPGYTWDAPTLTALGEVATREQLDPGLMREGTALVARLLTERAPVLTGEEAEDVLAQRWGSKYEHQIARATETWDLLPKKVQDDLTWSGIRYHPEFAEFLLKVAEHRWDPMTEAGLARIKARGLAALAAQAAKGAGAP